MKSTPAKKNRSISEHSNVFLLYKYINNHLNYTNIIASGYPYVGA